MCPSPAPGQENAGLVGVEPAGVQEPAQVATYECNSGFIREGDSDSLTCLEGSGMFTGDGITCGKHVPIAVRIFPSTS